MNFADKKIAEFDEKFCRWKQTYTLDTINNPANERVINNAIQLSDFENWLRKTIVEAERGKTKEFQQKFISMLDAMPLMFNEILNLIKNGKIAQSIIVLTTLEKEVKQIRQTGSGNDRQIR